MSSHKKISVPYDFQGRELAHPALHRSATDPTAWTEEGQVYFNTSTDQVRINTASGSNWRDLLRKGTNYTIEDNWTISGTWNFATNFTINSTTQIDNLNAEFLQGRTPSITAVANTIALRDGGGRSQFADPVADQDAATKKYVDALIEGRAYEQPVMVAVDSNINIASPSTATYDGHTLLVGDRVLLIAQTNPVQNGIYDWNGVSTAMTRSADADEPNTSAIHTSGNIDISNPGTSTFGGITVNTGDVILLRAQTDPTENGSYQFNGSTSALTPYSVFAELIPGSAVFVKKGTDYSGAVFNVSSPQAKKVIVPGQDQQVWTQTNAQSVYTADGNGIELSGTQFSLELDGSSLSKSSNGLKISATYAGQSSITTLGTITTGTWNGSYIRKEYGGTGLTTYTIGDMLFDGGVPGSLVRLPLGTANQFLRVSGNVPQWTDLTADKMDTSAHAAGAVFFSNGSTFASDVDNFFWNDSNNRLAVGMKTPEREIHIKATLPGLRLETSSGNAGKGDVSLGTSYGNLIYTANAGGAGGTATHLWKHSSTNLMELSSTGYLNLGGSSGTFTAGLFIAAPSTSVPTAIFTLRDNLASSFQIKEGSNNYISIDTNNGAEKIVFGNTATDPYYHFRGDNSLIIGEDPTIGVGNITDRLHVDGAMFSDTIQSQRIGRQGGYHLDGSNDYIELPKIAFGTGDFTLCFDLEHDDTPTAGEIIARTPSGNNRWIVAVYPTYYQLQIVNGSGVTSSYTFTKTPTTTRQSIIITADRDGDAKFYINGRLISSVSMTSTSSVNLGDGNANPLQISAASSSFDGKIYEARFYSVAKTHTEVINIAQGFNDRANLELHFSESSTETWGWRDISGNDRHGVNYGATRIESPISRSYVNHSEFTQWQKKDGGYKFNGLASNSGRINTNFNLAGNVWSVGVECNAYDHSTTRMLFSEASTVAPRYYVALSPVNNGSIQVRIADGTIDDTGSFHIPNILNRKMSLFFVFDNSSGYKIFIDGALVVNHSLTWNSFSSPTNEFEIGAYANGALGFNGEVYSVRLFNKAIASDVAVKYSRGEATAQSDIANLIAHYTPESATPALWEDVSGNERHAVNNGAAHLRPTLQESYVLEQKSISSKVGTGPGYRTTGTGQSISNSAILPILGLQDLTIVAEFTPMGERFQVIGNSAGSEIAILNDSSYQIVSYIGELAISANFGYYKITPGQKYVLVMAADRDGTASLWINGKKISEVNISGSAANSLSGNLLVFRGTSLVDQVGHSLKIFNRALTAAEVRQVSNGQNLGFADYGASGAASYTSDFSVDTNGWTATGGAASGNVDSIGGQDNTLRLLIDTTPGLHHLNKPSAFVIGKNYRLSGKFYIPSTNSHVDGLRLSYLGAVVIPELNFISPSTNTWVEFNAEFIAGATTLIAFAKDGASDSVTDPGGDDVIYIKDVVVTPIGLVLDLNEWGMAPGKWHDQSGNDYHGTVTGATLVNANEYLYTTWIVDKNGSIGGDGQVLSKSSTGLEWINVTAAGGAGDIDGAGNGVDNWMVIWDDTNTINRSTLVYDNGTTIGIGYSGTTPTLPAAAKLAVNGVVHATSYLWTTTTTHGLKFGTGYTELTNAAGGVRLSSLNFRPNQANTNLGDTSNPWGSAVFSGRLASYQNLGTEKIIMTSIDSAQLGRSNASSEAGAMFDLKMQTVSVGAGVGASVKLQPYRDEDNNNTLTAGAAWEYFPSDNAWGISSGSLKIGSLIISTSSRISRTVEANFSVAAHGGTASVQTVTVSHNLGTDAVICRVYERDNGTGNILDEIEVKPVPNTSDRNNDLDIEIVNQSSTSYYTAVIVG